MTLTDINKALSNLAEQPTRENILAFSFELLHWMNITPNADNKPQLLSPQTQRLKDYLANAPQTVQPQLYRLSADNQPIRVRFAVLKKLKKEYISQLVDNDPGLGSYQAMAKGLTIPATGTAFIPAQPYFIHFVTTPDYDKLVLIFNQGEQKRIVSFRNRLTNTQYHKIIQAWQGIGSKAKPEIADLLWKSLDIKEVNKEFYKQIKERFDALLGIVKTQHSTATENQVKQFTVRMIGRYIFCWFLKEKGIIPLSLISKQTIESTDKYYQTVLLKLFFETLNTKVQDRDPLKHNKLFEKIPYLNGGLFDESEEDKLFTKLDLDSWLLPFVEILESYDFTVDESSSQYQQVAVDPEMLGRIFENLLASQNEETEKLANQRKAFGAFYTPREIVDYMVNESIKAFLQTQWEQHLEADKTKHINNPEPIGDIFGNKKPQQLAIETKRYELKAEEKQKIEKSLEPLFASNPDAGHLKKEEKTLLLGFLEQIKILDPACGSGAFPMGILHKLVELHEALGTVKSSYELKKDILSQNIYGVDIMPMAIEIARLRAWLSLVLEEDYKPNDPKHNFGVKPLPNLDFKFVCANSLIDLGLDAFIQESKGTLHEGFTQKLVTQLKGLESVRKQFFTPALASTEKEKLKTEYFEKRDKVVADIEADSDPVLKQIANKIAKWNPFDDSISSNFFSPNWMFGIDKGFDIVIGNPPYIGEKGNEGIFQYVATTSLGKRTYTRWMDYFYFFFHSGIDYLKDNGCLIFISTNYYFTSTGGNKLRADLKNRTTIASLINFNELTIFESAAGQHNVITKLYKRKDGLALCDSSQIHINGLADSIVLKSILDKTNSETNYFKVTNDSLFDGVDFQIRIQGKGDIANTSVNISDVLQKMAIKSLPLGAITNITMGVVTLSDTVSAKHLKTYKLPAKKGDGIYVLSHKEALALNLSVKEKNTFLKPFYKNSDIKKFVAKPKNDLWLIYCKDEGEHILLPAGIEKHFEKYKELIVGLKSNFLKNAIAASVIKKWFANNNYFVLFTPKKESYFIGEKIVAPYRSKTNFFAYSDSPFYGSKDIAYILPKNRDFKLKYLTCILNSNLIFHWLYLKGKRKGEILEMYAKPLSEIPVKNTTNQKRFIDLHDKIVQLKSENKSTVALEKEIDVLVYKLYELTYDEVKIIDKEFWLSEAEYTNYKMQ